MSQSVSLVQRIRRPRATITAAAVVAGGLVTALILAGCGLVNAQPVDTTGNVTFSHPLAIPPQAVSHTNARGEKVFDIAARAGTSGFLAGKATRTQGFVDAAGDAPAGPYLGPTIVANRGDNIRVNVRNQLSEPTTVHWHGMHLPAVMDGGPHQMIAPGDTWSPHFPIDQQAATLWYHPHPHGETEAQVGAGMAGMVILHDESEQALNLPHEYGVDDVPVIVQDKNFDASGQFASDRRGFIGALGDTLLVNGTLGPYLDVTTDVVRLRLLNASPARVYNFQFDDKRAFDLIGTDGGLLSAPAPMSSIRLSPGERAEILLRMQPGQTATLQSVAPDLGGAQALRASNGAADRFDVLQLRAAAQLTSLGAQPSALVPMKPMAASDATVQRTFTLDGFNINNAQMDMTRIDETVVVNTTELWSVTNTTSSPHSFHVHDVQFQVLSAGGEPPAVELSGWKDTIYLTPRTEFRIIMRFTDYTDPDMPYMYHCHLLWHEDRGMMGQFVVVKPGQRAGTPPPIQGRDADHAAGSGPREHEGTEHEH
jgi:FtsP/CotA-like multicopper oxidase with cupredoxin domain